MQFGRYRYTDHLQALEACRPSWSSIRGGNSLALTRTPLVLDRWKQELESHPDRVYVNYILQGIEHGFRIGFDRQCQLQSASSNMPTRNPKVISNYLEREVSLGRMVRQPKGEGIHISPMGVIPKKHKPGKWRMIVDLSSPAGGSVNDGIDRDLSSLSYATIDHLSALVLACGKGAFLVKADIMEAYRMVPVHRDDQPLLGIQWRGETFIDMVLPFGLRSAPKIFTAMADAIQWILFTRGMGRTLHYLDDYILVTDDLGEATQQRQTVLTLFQSLGVPLEPAKLEGPSTCLTFLGIEVDTESLQLRLPLDKLDRLTRELKAAVGRKCLYKRELQSLTGLLQHASKVVRPGRAFMRNLHALQSVGSIPTHRVRLNAAARADIVWWCLFAREWNGVSMLWDLGGTLPEVLVFSDASGSWGCGAYCGQNWFSLRWPLELQNTSIQVKELVPVVIAAALYGKGWAGKVVKFMVDNSAVVDIIRAMYSREPHLMHLVRLLVFFAAAGGFWFTAEHISGVNNELADAISRDNELFFLSQVPQAQRSSSYIPPSLLALVAVDATWTSPAWTEQFSITIRQL